MAPKMNADFLTTFGGWVVALLTVLITGIVQWRRGNVDMTGQVMAEWQKLISAHQKQIESMTSEIANLRERLDRAERRIVELEEENMYLKRTIAQNSQSVAYQLGKHGELGVTAVDRADDMQDQIDALDRAGHNRKEDQS